jgi:hypothetical protein
MTWKNIVLCANQCGGLDAYLEVILIIKHLNQVSTTFQTGRGIITLTDCIGSSILVIRTRRRPFSVELPAGTDPARSVVPEESWPRIEPLRPGRFLGAMDPLRACCCGARWATRGAGAGCRSSNSSTLDVVSPDRAFK